MTNWPDEQEAVLLALADGTLDPAAASRVQARLADDPDAQARLELYRRSASALRVYDALAIPLVDDARRIARARDALGPIPPPRAAHAWALAASLLLVAGLLVLQYTKLPSGGPQALGPTLSVALEREQAGAVAAVTYTKRSASLTPLDTYVTADGVYCRSFLISDESRDLAEGYACRHGAARWIGDITDLATTPADEHEPADANSYAPAAAPDAIAARLQRGASTRLSSSATAALLEARWADPTRPTTE